MNIQEEKVDALNARLKLQIKAEDYLPKVDEALKKYRKQVNMKGFRKGMVPVGLVKKMYGQQIMVEQINELLGESVNNYIQEKEIDLLGYPIPMEGQDLNLEVDTAGDFDFEYEMGLSPEFEIKSLSSKTKFDKDVVDISDEMVDEEIESMRKRYGQPGSADDIQDDDILKIRLEELNEEGEVNDAGIENETTVNLRMIKEGKQGAVKALKKEEFLDGDIQELFDREAEAIAKHILDEEESTLSESSGKFRVTILEITRIQPAELDEAFFSSVLGDDEVKDEETFRDRIREEISKHYDRQSDQRLINKIADQFLEKTEIPLPEEFLRRWIKASNEKPISDEELERDFPNFAKNLRWSLIVNRIAKDNDIKVETEEMQERTRSLVMNQMYQYGIYNAEPAQVEQLMARYMQDRDHLSKMRDSILEEKVFDIIKDQVTVSDKKISLEEFNKES